MWFNNTVSLEQLYKRPFKNYPSLATSSEPATPSPSSAFATTSLLKGNYFFKRIRIHDSTVSPTTTDIHAYSCTRTGTHTHAPSHACTTTLDMETRALNLILSPKPFAGQPQLLNRPMSWYQVTVEHFALGSVIPHSEVNESVMLQRC